MPYSDCCFDELVRMLISEIQPQRCIDIGAGAGKYGRLIRSICPSAHITAVEIETLYVSTFRLEDIYDEIRCCDCIDLIATDIARTWDLVILGDVLEHLRKSNGIDLLHFLIYRSRYILVIYPSEYVQGAIDGVISEAHISVWGQTDFQSFDTSSVLRRNQQNFVIMAGYAEPRVTIEQIRSFVRLATSQPNK